MQLRICTFPLRNTPCLRLAKLFSAFAALCIASFGPANAADVKELPKVLQAKVEIAKKACEEFDNGEFGLGWGGRRES